MTSAYNQARPVISSTGLFTPADSISNEELVASFNEYVAQHNAQHAAAIEAGEMVALQPSSVEFIEKASGIKARKVLSKASRVCCCCCSTQGPIEVELGWLSHELCKSLFMRAFGV